MSLTLAERLKNLREHLAQALANLHGIQGAISVVEELMRDEAAAAAAVDEDGVVKVPP